MNKTPLKSFAAVVGAMIVAGALIFGGWKLERWINWKFDYGSRVEDRIEQLERRIEKLEKANNRDDQRRGE